jgi:hypothetical protein
MSEILDLRGGLSRALDEESGSAELCELLRDQLDGASARVVGLRRLKARVFRVEFANDTPWRSVVVKRLDPAVAQRNRLVAERWLPALAMGDRCARLLGVAADRRGDCIWHVYEDLGDETLAGCLEPIRIGAAVDLIAELHTRAARHQVLPDARRYGGNLGLSYFTSNVGDAIAALDALAQSGIETPQKYEGVADRLLDRLAALLCDTAERARYANRVIWPVHALLQERAAWGFPELAEVERWFEALDAQSHQEHTSPR